MSEISLNTEQLTDLFHEYASEDIVAATRSAEAFANEVYDVTDSSNKRYFLKILRTQLPEVVATEAQMQQRLAAAGLGTPKYLEIEPECYVGERDGTRFILSEYIPGKSPKEVTPGLIESFGTTLATLHNSLQGIDIAPSSMQWLNLERVQNDLSKYEGNTKSDLLKLVQAGGHIFDLDLPKAVIHGDLWMSNVFADGDTITTVFDLETAEYTVRLIDLARTYTSLAFNSSYSTDEIFSGLAKGYNAVAVEPLSRDELDNFNVAIAFVAGACATWHAVNSGRYLEPYIELGRKALQ